MRWVLEADKVGVAASRDADGSPNVERRDLSRYRTAGASQYSASRYRMSHGAANPESSLTARTRARELEQLLQPPEDVCRFIFPTT
jgi:hypothetical protein